jgi:ATP-binding cassette subfamily D (ALD) long-chain fatty acid import protein
MTPEELAEAMKQIYIKEGDGSKTLIVPYRDNVTQVSI